MNYKNECICPCPGYCDRWDKTLDLGTWEKCQLDPNFTLSTIKRRIDIPRPEPVRITYEKSKYIGLGNIVYKLAKLFGLPTCSGCKIRYKKFNQFKVLKLLWREICKFFPRLDNPIPKAIITIPWLNKKLEQRIEIRKRSCCMGKAKEIQTGRRGMWRRKNSGMPRIILPEIPSAIQLHITDNIPRQERLGIIGITTSPVWNVKENRPISNRNGLKPLVESLIDTGWSTRDVVVFAEPYANSIEGVRTVRREIRLGSWKNWFEGLKYLRSNYPNLQYYMMLQDDIIFCKKVREYVDTVANSIEFKDWGVLSLYLSERYGHGHTKGINRANVRWHWGACAYVFPPVSVDKLLLDGIIHQHTGNKVDVRIGAWALRSERGLYYNYPSLTQHRVNIPSSIAHGLGKGMKSSSFSPEYKAEADNYEEQVGNGNCNTSKYCAST